MRVVALEITQVQDPVVMVEVRVVQVELAGEPEALI